MTSKLIIYHILIKVAVRSHDCKSITFFFNNCKIVLRSLAGNELVTIRHENRSITFAIASAKMESLAHLYQVLCSWQYLHLYNGFNYTNEQICMRKDESPLLVLR